MPVVTFYGYCAWSGYAGLDLLEFRIVLEEIFRGATSLETPETKAAGVGMAHADILCIAVPREGMLACRTQPVGALPKTVAPRKPSTVSMIGLFVRGVTVAVSADVDKSILADCKSAWIVGTCPC